MDVAGGVLFPKIAWIARFSSEVEMERVNSAKTLSHAGRMPFTFWPVAAET